MVIPRSRSSGALVDLVEGESFTTEVLGQHVGDGGGQGGLPWSAWPMVPTFTCGLLRSNFSLEPRRSPSWVKPAYRRRRGILNYLDLRSSITAWATLVGAS